MTKPVLHEWKISPFCRKIRKILAFKGQGFETVSYNGLRAPRAARLSDTGKLPVLEFGGSTIQDSTAIAAFLDEKLPDPPLLPADPRDRARARILEDWADESLYWYEIHFRINDPAAFDRAVDLLCDGRPSYEKAIFTPLFRRSLSKKLREQGLGKSSDEDIRRRFFAILGDLDDLLADGGWLVDGRETLADIAVSSQIEEILRTGTIGDRILGHRNIAAWLERGTADPSA